MNPLLMHGVSTSFTQTVISCGVGLTIQKRNARERSSHRLKVKGSMLGTT